MFKGHNNYFFKLVADDLKRKGKDGFYEMKNKMLEFDFDKEFKDMIKGFNAPEAMFTQTATIDGIYTLHAELPGFTKGEVDITVDKGVMTVTANNGKKNVKCELTTGEDTVSKVTLELGILTIHMNEVKKATATKIKID